MGNFVSLQAARTVTGPKDLFHSICMSAAFRENMSLLQSLFIGHVGYFSANIHEYGVERGPGLPSFSSLSLFCSTLRKDPYFDAQCNKCDRKHLRNAVGKADYYCYVCHAGCWESMIILRGQSMVPLGVLCFGQVRAYDSLPDLKRYACHPNATQLMAYYRQLPFMNEETVKRWARVFSVVSGFIADNALLEVGQEGWARKVFEYVEMSLNRPITLQQIADVSGKSRSFVTHNFSQRFGVPFRRYVNERRIARAKALLSGGVSVKDVSSEMGFSDRYCFTKVFKQLAGVPPARFSRGKHSSQS